MSEVDVVIVGAGPVGLFLAIDLAQRGVSVQMIDKARAPTRHSRASMVWPRQLELLHSVGVADELLDCGRAIEGVAFHSMNRELGELRFSTIREAPYPFGLAISQEITERVLVKGYEARLGPLRRGGEVVGLAQGPLGVELTVRTEAGDQAIHAKWVVGADGAHSTVRQLAEIPFTGPPGQVRFGIGDAGLDGSLSTRMLHYIYSPTAAIGLSPFTPTTMRIAVSMPANAPAPDHAFFHGLLTQHHRLVRDVRPPEWTTAFDVRLRTADRFRSGRVLLAGDSAHVMSPAGGQGMNTGFQDAANLGWKLARVVHGLASESLLDTYDLERRAAAKHVSAASRRLAKWAEARGRIATVKRNAAVFLSTRKTMRPNLVDTITQLDTRYLANGPTPRGSRLGTRFPSFAGSAPARAPWSSWPAHHREKHTLFVWPGATEPGLWLEILDVVMSRSSHDVRDLGPITLSASVLRLGRRAYYFLVRPDGHVTAEGAFDGADGIPPSVLNDEGLPVEAPTTQEKR